MSLLRKTLLGLFLMSVAHAWAQTPPVGFLGKLPSGARTTSWAPVFEGQCDNSKVSGIARNYWVGNLDVLFVRKVDCFWSYVRTPVGTYYEVMVAGSALLVERSSVDLTPEQEAKLFQGEQLTQAVHDEAREFSLKHARSANAKLISRLAQAKSQPVFLSGVGAYEPHERSRFTGFGFVVHNNTKNTIKYTHLTYVGLNRVGDPVAERGRPSAIRVFKGIGPIEAAQAGSYSDDAAWLTDVVHSVDVKSVKVEFMTGAAASLDGKRLAQFSRAELSLLRRLGESFAGDDDAALLRD